MGIKIVELTQVLANLASVAAAVIGGIALGFAWGQIVAGKEAARESTAYATFTSYLEKSVEHPELACVDTPEKMAALAKDPNAETQYGYFVALMLSASEQILSERPGDAGWQRSVQSNLSCHLPFLSGPFVSNKDYESYNCQLRTLIADATRNATVLCVP